MAAKKYKKPLKLNLKEGAFTQYCKRLGFKGVTQACIQKGLKSKNPLTRKRANFARVARKWKKVGRKKKR